MGAELVDFWLTRAFNTHDVEAAAPSTQPIVDALLVTAKIAALVAGVGARSAKEVSHE